MRESVGLVSSLKGELSRFISSLLSVASFSEQQAIENERRSKLFNQLVGNDACWQFV